jgi:hypothetical protein
LALLQVIDGSIRRQAAYILADPWANAFRERFIQPEGLSQMEKRIGEALRLQLLVLVVVVSRGCILASATAQGLLLQ